LLLPIAAISLSYHVPSMAPAAREQPGQPLRHSPLSANHRPHCALIPAVPTMSALGSRWLPQGRHNQQVAPLDCIPVVRLVYHQLKCGISQQICICHLQLAARGSSLAVFCDWSSVWNAFEMGSEVRVKAETHFWPCAYRPARKDSGARERCDMFMY
jgi:hypothetical protein